MTTSKGKKKSEAIIPQEVISRLIEQAGENVVLVGGQALAYWANHYKVKPPGKIAYFTRDIDFLARSAADSFEVKRFADILDGYPIYPSKHSLTALIGQAVKEVSDDEYLNVDILHKVLSGTEGVRKRAVLLDVNGSKLKVMHPIDVLASRLINLHKLPSKQNGLGAAQLTIAIELIRAYLKEQFFCGIDMRPYMHFIIGLSKSDAGKKVARRWGIHVADSLDPVACSASENFIKLQMPSVVKAMSSEYRLVFEHAMTVASVEDSKQAISNQSREIG